MPRSTPNLMDLPLELFRQVLAEAIRCRGWKRGFRLRLVNRLFANEVIQVVNDFRMLAPCQLKLSQFGDVGAEFMARRLLNNKLPVSRRWDSIRRIAQRLALEDDDATQSYPAYVRSLCFRAAAWRGYIYMTDMCLHPRGPYTSEDYEYDEWDDSQLRYRLDEYKDSDYDMDLFAAAAFTNKISVLHDLQTDLSESEGFCPPSSNTFGCPYQLAAIGGNVEALKIVSRKLDGCMSDYFTKVVHLSCLEYVGLSATSSAISEELLPSTSSHFCIKNLSTKDIDFKGSPWQMLECALSTPHIEVFEQLLQFLNATCFPHITAGLFNKLLIQASRKGWEDMVQHLLGHEARPAGTAASTLYTTCLMLACMSGSEAAVRTWLEHGVAPEGREIAKAAGRGYWGIVKLLIKHGADVNVGSPRPITSAISLEREDMFLELLYKGAVPSGDVGSGAMERAKREGLETMVELLRQHGVDSQASINEPGGPPVQRSNISPLYAKDAYGYAVSPNAIGWPI